MWITKQKMVAISFAQINQELTLRIIIFVLPISIAFFCPLQIYTCKCILEKSFYEVLDQKSMNAYIHICIHTLFSFFIHGSWKATMLPHYIDGIRSLIILVCWILKIRTWVNVSYEASINRISYTPKRYGLNSILPFCCDVTSYNLHF